MLTLRWLEAGRAAELLLNEYLDDPKIRIDWALLKEKYLDAAKLAFWGSSALLHRNFGDDPSLRRLLIQKNRERFGEQVDWLAVVATEGYRKTVFFLNLYEHVLQAKENVLYFSGLEAALTEFATKWGLDYPWINEALLTRMLQDTSELPAEISDQD